MEQCIHVLWGPNMSRLEQIGLLCGWDVPFHASFCSESPLMTVECSMSAQVEATDECAGFYLRIDLCCQPTNGTSIPYVIVSCRWQVLAGSSLVTVGSGLETQTPVRTRHRSFTVRVLFIPRHEFDFGLEYVTWVKKHHASLYSKQRSVPSFSVWPCALAFAFLVLELSAHISTWPPDGDACQRCITQGRGRSPATMHLPEAHVFHPHAVAGSRVIDPDSSIVSK